MKLIQITHFFYPTENSYGFYDYTNLIQTAVEFNEEIIVLEEGARKGIDYLDQELEKSNPILVGVRHTYYKYIEGNTERRHKKNELNKNKSTDHFITIVGRDVKTENVFSGFMKQVLVIQLMGNMMRINYLYLMTYLFQ